MVETLEVVTMIIVIYIREIRLSYEEFCNGI